MDKLLELELELNYIRWRKSECIYNSRLDKAAFYREKENSIFSK